MENNLTELVFILDKSGSMSGLEKDTIGGFNSLLEKQRKQEGDTLVSLVLFSNELKTVHYREYIKDIPNMSDKDYIPSGCTALLDAIGITVSKIRDTQYQYKEEYKPNKTIFVITTDGMENSSKEYNYESIKKLIDKTKEEFGYEYIFLGANIDVVKEAESLGIDKDMAIRYKADSKGMSMCYKDMGVAINKVRKKRK